MSGPEGDGIPVKNVEQHEALIQALMDPARWRDGGGDRRRIDTHISTVVLAGEYAYKLKKPLDLGFLDFLSMNARRDACREELRLNSRLAPQIYQRVCRVTGTIDQPVVDSGVEDTADPIDWAVRMRRFDPDAILSAMSAQLTPGLIASLAVRVAEFHRDIAVCDPREPFGDPDATYQPMTQNLQQIRAFAPDVADQLPALEEWTQQTRRQLDALLLARKQQGFIRECHGDLHLGNVALIEGEPIVFDAIEFNPGLRWIDTANDIGFMTMDLRQRGRPDLAARFLDAYLRESGDFECLHLLRFYEVYRALVRAKIAAIRSSQADLEQQERRDVMAELAAYLSFALTLIQPRRGAVVITRGVSGSGKSYLSEGLLDHLPVVRLRSDVERKRLLGIKPTDDASNQDAYSSDLTEQTYARLESLARETVRAGYVALVDATFLKRAQRSRFRALAEALAVPFVILDVDAPVEVLQARILRRRTRTDNVSDADLGVLQAQLSAREPLDDAESEKALTVTPDQPLDPARLAALIKTRA